MKRKHPLLFFCLFIYCCYALTACKKPPIIPHSKPVAKVTTYEPGTGTLRYVREYTYNHSGKAATIQQTDYDGHEPLTTIYQLSFSNDDILGSVRVTYASGHMIEVSYSYDTMGRLAAFMSPDFLPSYVMAVRYDEHWPTPESEPSQISVSDNNSKLKRTDYYLDANNCAYRIIKGLYYVTNDLTYYRFSFSAVRNPEYFIMHSAMFFDYPVGVSWLNREVEVVSPLLPDVMLVQRNQAPPGAPVKFAYDKDRLGRVKAAYVVGDGGKQLWKEYEYVH